MTTNPIGQPFDIDAAIADVRRAHRERTDPMSLKSIELGEAFARQIVVTFPNREEWPIIARVLIAGHSQTLSMFPDHVMAHIGLHGLNFARLSINAAISGAIDLLDRYEAETDEATRNTDAEPHWFTRVDEIVDGLHGTSELKSQIRTLVGRETERAYEAGARSAVKGLREAARDGVKPHPYVSGVGHFTAPEDVIECCRFGPGHAIHLATDGTR